MICTKRAYEEPSPDDGRRILVDRLWPRGVSKEAARIDEWRRDLSPSDALRRGYGHDPARFPAFRERYRAELLEHRDALDTLVVEARARTLTLVYAVKDSRYCNAAVLKELLEEFARRAPTRAGKRS